MILIKPHEMRGPRPQIDELHQEIGGIWRATVDEDGQYCLAVAP
jgi:hypothetical protein